MSTIDPLLVTELEQALGSDAIASLLGRDLIRPVHVPPTPAVDSELVRRRVAGAVAGLALGDALAQWSHHAQANGPQGKAIAGWLRDSRPSDPDAGVTAATQLFVLAAEAWLRDGLGAPEAIADDLAARGHGLRSPGRAVRQTLRALREDAPWFEAGSSSYGDAALPRAVAAGLASLARPDRAGVAGSLDAAVTHASKSAALCSATLAGLVVALVNRPNGADWRHVAREVIASVDHEPTRELLARVVDAGRADGYVRKSWSTERPLGSRATMGSGGAVPGGDAAAMVKSRDWFGDQRPVAAPTLALAIHAQHAGDDPVTVLVAALSGSQGNRSAVAVAGALFGAVHGVDALPPRRHRVEGADQFGVLAERLAAVGAPEPADPRRVPEGDDSAAGADIWFLLDRSGSMSSIAHDVVVGFEQFFAEQRAVSGDATVTVVQFDDADPHDVLVDARPVGEVRSIREWFEPRGATPLYDAIGLLLDRAEANRGAADDQLVVIFTDGLENASQHWSRNRLFRRINQLRTRGWTFVFLGANQDSYATGSGLAMAAGNISNFRADAVGVAASYAGLSRSTREWRQKARSARRRDVDLFWGGVKEAEDL